MHSSSLHASLEEKLSMRPYIRAGYILILILMLTVGAWATLANIQTAIISPGQVAVETGRNIVQHKYGGNVKEILVKENDFVETGQVLIRLDGTEAEAQLAANEFVYYESQAQIDRISAENESAERITFSDELLEAAKTDPKAQSIIDAQVALFDARERGDLDQLGRLEERVAQYDTFIANTQTQIQRLEEQKSINDDEVRRQLLLKGKGLSTTAAVTAVKNTQSQIQSNLITAQTELARFQSEKDQAQSELASYRSDRRERNFRELQQSRAELSRSSENLRQLRDQVSRLDILSPNDGYVYELKVNSTEAVISPAEPIMFVIPNNADFVLQGRVRPNDIDDVYVGQEAQISFSAVRSNTLPKLEGKVTKVSADAITNPNTGEIYFEVETKILPNEIDKLQGVDLHPGMPAEVYFITAEQSPLAYLTEPARRYFDRSLR